MDTANGQFNGTAQFAFLQRVDLEHALPKMDSVVTDASCVVTDASCMARVQKGMLSRIEGILGVHLTHPTISGFCGKTKFTALSLVDKDSKFVSQMIQILDDLQKTLAIDKRTC